jgi:hypothetical protein
MVLFVGNAHTDRGGGAVDFSLGSFLLENHWRRSQMWPTGICWQRSGTLSFFDRI